MRLERYESVSRCGLMLFQAMVLMTEGSARMSRTIWPMNELFAQAPT